jgi:hypothetical protein
MERFLEQHRDQIKGVLAGYDRLSIRGTLRQLCYQQGIETFLCCHHVKYKDFGDYSQRLSQQLRKHVEGLAQQAGRPVQYLESSTVSKEDLAREIMERDQVHEGLVCVLTSVEPCRSFRVFPDRQTQHLHVRPADRKCLFFYLYYCDRDFGLMHIRLQSWLPFGIQIWVNGRSWLARQLDREGIGYQRNDNCFSHIDNLPRAQRLMDQLTRKKFGPLLRTLARRVNPLLKQLNLFGYYWSVRSSEFATDVMFHQRAALEKLYLPLLHHAIEHFHTADILRFLGRRTNKTFSGEATTDHGRGSQRCEGVRIKHWVEENSIKMYDKGSVLRVETTINNQQRFSGRRWMTTPRGHRYQKWLPLRKGIVDMPAIAAISRAANERYLEAMAVVMLPRPVAQMLDPVCHRKVHRGRPYRPLHPITKQDAAIFGLLLDARFQLKGFRNSDVSQALWPREQLDQIQRRKASGRCTRLLNLLRAHHLIGKVAHTRYYRLTLAGQRIMSTALQLRTTDLARLAA